MATVRSSCIDGRAHGSLYGSPGGDGGLLLRVLLAAKKVIGYDPSSDDIRALIAKSKRPLYFHTDNHATHHYDPRKTFSPECSSAGNIGCGYFKASIHSPEKIGPSDPATLSAVAAKVWTALCALAAQKSPAVECVELTGNHAENDVVVVEKFEPADPAGHCFVYHPGHEEAVGAQFIDLIPGGAGKKPEIAAALKEICAEHWNGAISLLAPGVPHRYIRADGTKPKST
jgi:hypothetical protein